MTVEEVKKFAKEQYGKDLTDEQVREIMGKAAGVNGELSDEALDAVSGGFNWKAAVGLMVGVGMEELSKKV